MVLELWSKEMKVSVQMTLVQRAFGSIDSENEGKGTTTHTFLYNRIVTPHLKYVFK
jgi:hypothetical protein